MQINYSMIIPDDSFIGKYLAMMNNSETPQAFDFWSAVWILGAHCGRDVIVDRPRSPVHMNWYVILVGESGRLRKSTTIEQARKYIENLGSIITTKCSPESLINHISDNYLTTDVGSANICVSELVTFLGKERYTQTMPGLLTDIYDCPDIRESSGTITNGKRTYKNVFVNFLAASTPSWLSKAVNPDVIEGGFTSRTLFITANKPKKQLPWPEETSNDDTRSINTTLAETVSIAQAVGKIKLSDTAKSNYARWYCKRESYKDTFRASFAAREDSHVLRLAGILCINDGSMQIASHHISKAIRIIEHVRDSSSKLFDVNIGVSTKFRGIEKVRTEILRAGSEGIYHRSLYNGAKRFLEADDFNKLITIMHELELIRVFIYGTTKKGKLYKSTRKLSDDKLVSKLFEALEDLEV